MNEAVQTQTGYLDVEGAQLYYEVAGSGHPLVFVHAGVADHTMWDEQWDFFAARYRVIRYDMRSFGKSRTEVLSFSERQDLYNLLKHLGVEKTYLLGLSRGGSMTVDFTLEHPDMVDALVVVAGGVSGYRPSLTGPEMELFNLDEPLWEQGLKTGDFSALVDLDARIWADGPLQAEGRADPSVRDRLKQMCLQNYTAHQVDVTPIPLDPPANERLDEIKIPTLVIVGDFDTTGTQNSMHKLAKSVAGARLVVVPGVAHMVNMEVPNRFNATVLGFLQNLGQQ